MRICLVSHVSRLCPHNRSVFRTRKPTSGSITLLPCQRVEVILLDMLAPRVLRCKGVRRVSLETRVARWVGARNLLATVAPQTLKSIARSLLLVDLEDVELECLEIVQLSLALVPLAFERLVLSSTNCNAWGARNNATGLFARSYIA